jgi:hypothetical protein
MHVDATGQDKKAAGVNFTLRMRQLAADLNDPAITDPQVSV